MLKERMNFTELMSGMEEEFRKRGQTYKNQLNNLYYCQLIIRLHEERGLEYLDHDLIAEHIRQLHERIAEGSITKQSCQGRFRNIRLLVEYNDTGRLSWDNIQSGSTYEMLPSFTAVADAYLTASDYHPNTRNDARWVTHKYFVWLSESGCYDLSGADTMALQQFLVFCSKNMTPSSMHDVKLHLRKLYDYLSASGLSNIPYKELLSFKVNRESKIYPCVPKEDIAAMLEAIDRNTKRGRRDYAILLLGAVTGLRAIDVAKLKLGDINWIRGEIKLVQSKTGTPVVLPLTQDVGEAVQEYILKARPKTEIQNIFLRINAPHTELKSAVTISDIYNDWRKVAGLPISRRFHSLRRTLGRDMVTGGVPVTTVAQVLGQTDVNSAKKYISLDSKHLKLCALTFDGIIPKGGVAGE